MNKTFSSLFYIIFTTFALFFSTQNLFAQKVKYKKETIWVDEQPYAILEKISNGAMQPNSFILKTLDNQEVLIAKIQQLTTTDGYFNYNIYFVKSGSKSVIRVANINAGERLAKIFFENEIIKDNVYNPNGEKHLLLLHDAEMSNNEQDTTIVNLIDNSIEHNKHYNLPKPLKYKTIQRSQNDAIIVLGDNQIMQGSSFIGKYTTQRTMKEGKFYTNVEILLLDGTKIGEANFIGITTYNNASIITYKDQKTHTIAIKEAAHLTEIITFFVIKEYL